ncbi:testis-specific Y-encoded protein 3-like [Mustela lutreola]|uniref:testis-specific Y-encoded protein 3-like n=1 Tax=Mustela lutreola TaxID=9666 RepID=UPI002796F25D|nr:testis-specific Y-encoded protein 3-like [Mustela lutreola]
MIREEGITEAISPQGQEGKGLLDRDFNPPPHFAARQVEELGSPRDRRRVLLFFRKNSYFRNEVVEKEYVLRAAGYEPSHSTPIQWHPCYEREARSRRHHNSSLNFFNWLSDHSFAGSSRIAEIVMDDLWPNPLQYYMRKKAPAEELRGVQELQHVEVNTQEPCA